jgi:hypothetical protein
MTWEAIGVGALLVGAVVVMRWVRLRLGQGG